VQDPKNEEHEIKHEKNANGMCTSVWKIQPKDVDTYIIPVSRT
jgi:hypothetical protein